MFFVLYHSLRSDSRISNFSKLFWLCHTQNLNHCVFLKLEYLDDRRLTTMWVMPKIVNLFYEYLQDDAQLPQLAAQSYQSLLSLVKWKPLGWNYFYYWNKKKYRYAKLPSSNYNRPAFLVGSVKALYLLKGKYSDSKFSGKTQSRKS